MKRRRTAISVRGERSLRNRKIRCQRSSLDDSAMPAETGLRLYWDADVLVSWIDNHPERAPLIDVLLGDARGGKVEIFTSAVSQVEVAFSETERARGSLSPAVDQQITELWAPGSPIKVVEFYPLIGTRARNLIRDNVPRGWSGLRANDAIHLATAAHLG